MPTKVTIEQLEKLLHEMTEQGKELSYDLVKQELAAKNLSIREEDFYKHIYKHHLYDWKMHEAPEKIQAELKAQERIGELEKSLSQVRATLESTEDGILMLTREGKIVNFNQKFVKMFRFPNEILDPRNEPVALQYILDQVVDPQELFQVITRCYDDPTIRGEMGDLHFKDGRIFERYSQPHFAGEQIVGRVWSFRDVTGRRKQDQELRLRERAIQASTSGVLITDSSDQYQIHYVNPAFERLTGYTSEEIMGTDGFSWCKFKNNDPAFHNLRLALRENREDSDSAQIFTKDGKLIWLEINIAPVPNPEGEISNFIWIINDITQRKLMEERLEHQATHDGLTELPNRVLLRDRLQQAVFTAKRTGKLVAIWFLDLDRFKLTNDSLGHDVGDKLLIEIGHRIKSCVRETDTVARLGGDEFVIISTLDKSELEAVPLAKKILKKVSNPVELENRIFNITASIGISIYPKNGEDIETLMKSADIAMYKAKESGRDNFQFFTAEMNERLSKRLMLENDLRKALKNNELMLHYQPLLDVKTGKVSGLEALIRWKHPEKGMIPPLDFIPIAEESGLIIPIGEWVLETACAHHNQWCQIIEQPLHIAINISSQQFSRSDFLKTMEKLMKKIDLVPHSIELELTESILIDESDTIHTTLNRLKEYGFQLVIDDFGTGYSSLSYLRRFPLDKIKVDKSFIDGVEANASDAAIVQTIIAMGHILGLTVLAEGVETEAQLNFLRKFECDEMQGFFFSKPLDEDKITELLKSGRHLPPQ